LSGADDMLTCESCGAVGRDFIDDDGDIISIPDADYNNSREFLDAVAMAKFNEVDQPEPKFVQHARIGTICISCGGCVGHSSSEPVRQSWMGRVLGDLAALGYDAEWECLPAAAFGAPHLRYRTFIVGYRGKLSYTDGQWSGDQSDNAGNGLGRRISNDVGSVCETVADTMREGRGLQPVQCRRTRSERTASDVVQRSEAKVQDDVADTNGTGRTRRASCEANRHGGSDRRPSAEVLQGKGDSSAGVLRRERIDKWPFWTTEPPVGRVADGVSARVDRLRCLGNAVVPQVANWIGRCIINHAKG
jgi:site-specific DNA-cytosine methylase